MTRRSVFLRLDWDDQDVRYGVRLEALPDREGTSHRELKAAIRELCNRHGVDPTASFEFPIGQVLDVPLPICPTWDPNCGDPPEPDPLMCVCKIEFKRPRTPDTSGSGSGGGDSPMGGPQT